MSAGIVVGYDGSDSAKEAVRVALEVGKAYGEPVKVVCAYELNPVGGEMHDYQEALKELATKRLHEATALASTDGVEVHAELAEEAPARALVDVAERDDARVIIIGTRGEHPLAGVLLGSTAHKLLHLSHRPVLVVPSADR